MFKRLKTWFDKQVAEGVASTNKDYTKMWVKQARKLTEEDIKEQRACADMKQLPNLAQAFPKDVVVPPLIYDFCHMLTITPIGSIGWLELTTEDKIEILLPSYFEENDNFAMFLSTPDGGLVGLWLKDDRDPSTAPFVWMDSEGTFKKLAPNFLYFLDRLTKLDFDEDEFCDFLPEEEMEDTEEDAPINLAEFFRDWLEGHPDVDQALLKAAPESYADCDDGSAQRWINKNFTL